MAALQTQQGKSKGGWDIQGEAWCTYTLGRVKAIKCKTVVLEVNRSSRSGVWVDFAEQLAACSDVPAMDVCNACLKV
jgi:hypothetical protein